MTNPIPTATLLELIELGEKATERPWKCWNGWGPSKGDGLMRCERIGPSGSFDGITPSSPEECIDLKAKTEDFEFLAASANLAVPLAREVMRLREVLREIAHAPEYDGSLCPDPEDCPNCIAKEALRAQ